MESRMWDRPHDMRMCGRVYPSHRDTLGSNRRCAARGTRAGDSTERTKLPLGAHSGTPA
jgi:hypothetical protein